jgi:hypothetical protein
MQLSETFSLYHHGYDATVRTELNWHRTESTACFVFAYTTCIMKLWVKKGKLSLCNGPSRLPHFLTIGSHMAVRLSNLRASHPLSPERFLVLISAIG